MSYDLVRARLALKNHTKHARRVKATIGLCAWFCALTSAVSPYFVIGAIVYGIMAAFEIEQERQWREQLQCLPVARMLT